MYTIVYITWHLLSKFFKSFRYWKGSPGTGDGDSMAEQNIIFMSAVYNNVQVQYILLQKIIWFVQIFQVEAYMRIVNCKKRKISLELKKYLKNWNGQEFFQYQISDNKSQVF